MYLFIYHFSATFTANLFSIYMHFIMGEAIYNSSVIEIENYLEDKTVTININ